MRLPAIALALALSLVAGCGGGDGTDGNGDGAAGDAQTVQISATDFAFDPAELSVEAGSVSFELSNDGSAPHALEIEGGDVDESSETIDSGESTTLEVELAEGTYEIYCPVGDHRDRGMEGTLTVGAGGAGGGGDTGEDDGGGGGAGGYGY